MATSSRWVARTSSWALAWTVAWTGLAGDGLHVATSHEALAVTPGAAASADDIARLIRQLGASDYAARSHAEARLRRLGPDAFDALFAAQQDDDIEVALRARYLLRSMNFSGARRDDPPLVRKYLQDYARQNATQRSAHLESLARLEAHEGVAALCRLTRFETDERLSKQAALLVLTEVELADQAQRRQLATVLRQCMGASQRVAAGWLRLYADTLEADQVDQQAWREVISAEHQKLLLVPEQTSSQLVRDVTRWYACLLWSRQRDAVALDAMRKTLELLDGSPEQLLSAVTWLMDQEAWPLVDELSQRYSAEFATSTVLTYCRAEAQRGAGQNARADRTAATALALEPQDARRHNEAAVRLQQRGLFHWSEREYRHVMELGPKGSRMELTARYLLSEMLHDQRRDGEAAKVLEPIVEAIQKRDPQYLESVQATREPAEIEARMHFFFAAACSSQDLEQARKHLLQAFDKDPTDADVLIGLFRLPDPDAAWRQQCEQRIREAADSYREEIRRYRQLKYSFERPSDREMVRQILATFLNQLAWLVSNTTGDLEEALQCSRESLELRPNTAGYFDTLGRCHFAKGELEEAIKAQSRAVELEPFSGQIRRQLDDFRAALPPASPATAQATSSPHEGTR